MKARMRAVAPAMAFFIAAGTASATAGNDACSTTYTQMSTLGSAKRIAEEIDLTPPATIWSLTRETVLVKGRGKQIDVYMPTFTTTFSVDTAKMLAYVERVVKAQSKVYDDCGGLINDKLSASVGVSSHQITAYGIRSQVRGKGRIEICIRMLETYTGRCKTLLGEFDCPKLRWGYTNGGVRHEEDLSGDVAVYFQLAEGDYRFRFSAGASAESLSDLEKVILRALTVSLTPANELTGGKIFKSSLVDSVEAALELKLSDTPFSGGGRDSAEALVAHVASQLEQEGKAGDAKDLRTMVDNAFKFGELTTPVICLSTRDGQVCNVANNVQHAGGRLNFSAVRKMQGQRVVDELPGGLLYASCDGFASLMNALAKYDDDRPELIYGIKRGDSLWRIAKQHYGRPGFYIALASYNKLRFNSVLHPGSSIKVPAFRDLISAGDAIARGDSLWRRFGADYKDLLPQNQHIGGPDVIYPGQIVWEARR